MDAGSSMGVDQGTTRNVTKPTFVSVSNICSVTSPGAVSVKRNSRLADR